MQDNFSRTELLLGREAMHRLSESRVAVFGLGGVGSAAAEALARSGVGILDLVDHDIVSRTNINRQLIATELTVGREKVDVMKERIRAINPDAVVNTHACFYMPDTAAIFDLSVYDYIIDAMDTVTAKIELIVRAKAAGTPIISCMGTGNKLEPEKFEVTDISKTYGCPLARVMRKELRARGIQHLKVVFSPEEPVSPAQPETPPPGRRSVPASNPWVPAAAGLLLGSAVVRDLIGQFSQESAE